MQSHVRAHVELMWLLSSATPISWLNKMIQFKEKSRKAVRLYCMQLNLYMLLYGHFHLRLGKRKIYLLRVAKRAGRRVSKVWLNRVGLVDLKYFFSQDFYIFLKQLVCQI